MNEVELKNEFLAYPESLLEAWKLGDYTMLTHSNASDYIKKILTFKAKNRTGRRFFGEAYIASRIEMKEGWYNSFKWLTADKWLSGGGLEPKFEKPFSQTNGSYSPKTINFYGGLFVWATIFARGG